MSTIEDLENILCQPGRPLWELAALAARDGIALSFDDVTLEQGMSDSTSRADVDPSTWFARDMRMTGGFICLAPMPDLSWFKAARAAAKAGIVACVHRMPLADWWDGDEAVLNRLSQEDLEREVIRRQTDGFQAFLQDGFDPLQICLSISLATYRRGHVDALWEVAHRVGYPGRLCVLFDTANGDNTYIYEAITALRRRFGMSIILGAGNFTTGHAFLRAAQAGADFARGPIGTGNLCTTTNVAGVGVPAITVLAQGMTILRKNDLLFRESGRGMTIIQDGGTGGEGNRIKGLCAGADSSMRGTSMMSVLESGAQRIELTDNDGKIRLYIVARGAASEEIVRSVRPRDYHRIVAEGAITAFRVDPENPVTVADVVAHSNGALGSTCGYWGARNITELREKHRGWRVTGRGAKHGIARAAVENPLPPDEIAAALAARNGRGGHGDH